MGQEAPDGRLRRLEFQTHAALVQLDLTRMVQSLQIMVDGVLHGGSWSGTDTPRINSIRTLAEDQARLWLGLAPPEALRHNWEDLIARFEQLSPLIGEFAALENAPPDQLTSLVIAFQSRISTWLHETNRLERKLLEQEWELAGMELPSED